MKEIKAESCVSSSSGRCDLLLFRDMEHLSIENSDELACGTYGTLGLAVAYSSLLIVRNMPEVHQVGEGGDKAGRHDFSPAHEELYEVAMHAFMRPFVSFDPLRFQCTDRGLKGGEIAELLLQTQLGSFESPLGPRPIHKFHYSLWLRSSQFR
jgi:hypothetical protein